MVVGDDSTTKSIQQDIQAFKHILELALKRAFLFFLDRGVILPLGLDHQSFPFNLSRSKKRLCH
jgi:hypothetical protein